MPLSKHNAACGALIAALVLAAFTAQADVPSRCEYSQMAAELSKSSSAPDFRAWLQEPNAQHIEPFRAFDNVWYVGGCFVGSWAIVTPAGVALIDTMYEPLVGMLIANLRKAGIEPDRVRYVFVTHGHWDHVDGAQTLKIIMKNARLVMSEKAWHEAQHDSLAIDGFPPWETPRPDILVKDGDEIQLGNERFVVYETPGHTPGTISLVYDVMERGKTYRALTLGGLGVGTIHTSKAAQDYIESVKRVEGIVADSTRPISVDLSTHPVVFRDLVATSRELRARNRAGASPFVDQKALLDELEGLRRDGDRKLREEMKAGR